MVKNNLLRRALQGSNLPDLETYLHGQSAVVMGESDVSAAAKVLKNFAAEFQKPKIKVGILDKAVLNVDADHGAGRPAVEGRAAGQAPRPAARAGLDVGAPDQHTGLAGRAGLKAYSEKGEQIA